MTPGADDEPDRDELARARSEIERLRQTVAAQEQTIAILYKSHVTLDRVLNGGWWRLRGRLQPALRLAGAARRRLRGRLDRSGQGPLT